MNVTAFRSSLRQACWLPILGAAVAVGLQAWHVMSQPTQFSAAGRIMVGSRPPISGGELSDWVKAGRSVESFYADQIRLMESEHLRLSALKCVRALHPQLQPCPVEVQVTNPKDSAILKVLAIGAEPKFTHQFIDALMDEYIAYRNELRDATIEADKAKLAADVKIREKKMKETKVKFDEALKASQDGELLEAEKMRLAEQVSHLRGEWEALKASASPTDAAEARLKDAEAQLQDVIGKSAMASERALALESLKLAHRKALRDFEEMKGLLQGWCPSGRMEPEAIMERPGDAPLHRPPFLAPLVISGVLGFVGGLLLMLFISLVAALKSRPAVQPPPLS